MRHFWAREGGHPRRLLSPLHGAIFTLAACAAYRFYSLFAVADSLACRWRWPIVIFAACAAYKYTRRLCGEQKGVSYESYQRNVRDA